MRSAFALRIISGRTILNFGVQKRLRAFLNPIFTDGVVMENGICSAAALPTPSSRKPSAGWRRNDPLSVKMGYRKVRRLSCNPKFKIVLPLMMRKANAERILNP